MKSTPQPAPELRPTPWYAIPRVLALLVFLFACILYAPSLHNGFVWDDMNLIVDNQDIGALDGATVQRLFTSNYWAAELERSGLYRPLTALSFHIDHRLYGTHPAGFHLTNLLLNGAVCALVFLVLMQLFAHVPTALMASLVFAAIPLHTENVAWIAGRTDLLAMLWMLASVAIYVHWRRRRSTAGLALALLCFAAALLAKETACILPPLVLLLEFGPVARLSRGRGSPASRVSATLAFFVVAAIYFLVRQHVLGAAVSAFAPFVSGPANTVALSLSIFAHYVYKLIFPFVLNVESDVALPAHVWDLHALVGLAMLAVGGLVVYRWRRRGEVIFAAAVLALGLAPVLNLIPVTQVSAERFLYFPSLGFALFVALAAGSAPARWRRPVLVAFAFLITAYSIRTVARTLDWRDELTLFRKTVAASGDSARAHAALGNALLRQEQYAAAMDEFRRATELSSGYAAGWSGLGRALGKLGRTDEAIANTRKALDIAPEASMWTRLGILLMQSGDHAGAADSFRRALELRPRNPYARYNLALSLFAQNDYEGTIRELSAMDVAGEEFVPGWYFLAESEARLGRSTDASAHAARFLALYKKDDALTKRARELAGR